MLPVLRWFLTGFVLLFVVQAAQGQGNAELRILAVDTSDFPEITLHVQLLVNGRPLAVPGPTGFSVAENGMDQLLEFVSCPRDTVIRLSIAILLDRSGSMTTIGIDYDPDSTKLRSAKEAIRGFLGLIDPRDETALLSFSSTSAERPYYSIEQFFTTDVREIDGALTPIYAQGGTRLWDAMSEALQLLAGRTGRRVLIVITDGISAQDQFADQGKVVELARASRIPLFMIGLGSGVALDVLGSTARATGGRFYFSPGPDQLQEILALVAKDIAGEACVLRYVSSLSCMDGSERFVSITSYGPSGLLEADTSYTAPNMVNPLTIAAASVGDVSAGLDFEVPLLLKESLSTQAPATCFGEIVFDERYLAFDTVLTARTMSSGVTPLVNLMAPGRVRFSLRDFLPTTSSGVLLILRFRSLSVSDTAVTTVRLENLDVTQRCSFALSAQSGVMRLIPCGEVYDLGGESGVHLALGEKEFIPVRCSPALPSSRRWEAEFLIRYRQDRLRLLDATLHEDILHGILALIDEGPGLTRIYCAGVISRDLDTPIRLLMASVGDREAGVDSVLIVAPQFNTQCEARVVPHPVEIATDGYCDRMVKLRATASQIRVFPQPARDILQIEGKATETEEMILRLRDSFGRIRMEDIVTSGDRKFSLSWIVRDLPAGLYLMEVHSASGRRTFPIVLVR